MRRHKIKLVTLCNDRKLCARGLFGRELSVNCPSEPEKLHCLDIIQINEAIEATKLQPLTQDSMEQQRSADGEQGGL